MEDNGMFLTVLVIGSLALIVMVILFAGGTIVTQSGATESENFQVDDTTTDFDCNLDKTPSSSSSVQYYNGTAWTTLTTAQYTLTDRTVTVAASAMD